MASRLHTIALCIAFLGIALSANAATVFDNNGGAGDSEITTVANWTNGLPTLANLGTVGINSTWGANIDFSAWNVSLTGGTMTVTATDVADNEITNGTILTFQGGSFTRQASVQSISGASTITFSSGTANFTGVSGGLELSGCSSLEISGGGVSTNTFVANDTSFANFPLSSTGTLTITGAIKSDFETLYSAGAILYAGSNSGDFDTNFIYGESSIAAVPEPATVSLLALGGIAMLKRRKR